MALAGAAAAIGKIPIKGGSSTIGGEIMKFVGDDAVKAVKDLIAKANRSSTAGLTIQGRMKELAGWLETELSKLNLDMSTKEGAIAAFEVSIAAYGRHVQNHNYHLSRSKHKNSKAYHSGCLIEINNIISQLKAQLARIRSVSETTNAPIGGQKSGGIGILALAGYLMFK